MTETDEITYTSILQSSAASYSKQNLNQSATYEMSENDMAGPFDVGV